MVCPRGTGSRRHLFLSCMFSFPRTQYFTPSGEPFSIAFQACVPGIGAEATGLMHELGLYGGNSNFRSTFWRQATYLRAYVRTYLRTYLGCVSSQSGQATVLGIETEHISVASTTISMAGHVSMVTQTVRVTTSNFIWVFGYYLASINVLIVVA